MSMPASVRLHSASAPASSTRWLRESLPASASPRTLMSATTRMGPSRGSTATSPRGSLCPIPGRLSRWTVRPQHLSISLNPAPGLLLASHQWVRAVAEWGVVCPAPVMHSAPVTAPGPSLQLRRSRSPYLTHRQRSRCAVALICKMKLPCLLSFFVKHVWVV